MARLHLTIQGKGGIGKSVTAAIIAQHRKDRGYTTVCIDTDPINRSFSRFQGLDVQVLELMQGRTVNARAFDSLVEQVILGPPEGEHIVDCGATAFIPLSAYLIENEIGKFLNERDHELVLHVVLVGGQAAIDTLNGLDALASQIPDPTRIVCWMNNHFGPLELNDDDVIIDVVDTTAFRDAEKRIDGKIEIRKMTELEGKDLQQTLLAHMTFEEALLSTTILIMAKHRLKKIKDELFRQLDIVLGSKELVNKKGD